MHARFSIWLLIILQLLCLYSEVINSSDNYLPFVMVKHKGTLELPNRVDEAVINKFLGFTGDTQFSKDGSKDQMFFCPLHTVKQLDDIKKANNIIRHYHSLKNEYGEEGVGMNCLFRKRFKKGEELRCADDATASVKPVRLGEQGDKSEKLCGPYGQGILLKLFYHICAPVKIFHWWKRFTFFKSDYEEFIRKSHFHYEHYIVYEICYNHIKSNTVYTKHTLKSVDLLYDGRLEREKRIERSRKFPSSYYDNGQLKNSGDMKHLPKEKESYTNESLDLYFAQTLVPANDMITALMKKTTFSEKNVKPMHQHLQKVWNYIEELIRKNFRNRKTENEITIYTGAFTSLIPEPNSSGDKTNDVPLVWIKLIYEKKDLPIDRTLVIIMKNDNEFTNVTFNRDPTLTTLCTCTEDHCKFFKQDVQVFEKFGSLVYKIRCCPFNKEINSAFFDIDLTYGNELLHINNFTHSPRKILG